MSTTATRLRSGRPPKFRNTRGSTRYVFWILFGVSLLNYTDRYVFVGAANAMAHDLGFHLDGIGTMTTLFQLVYTLGTIPLSIWADRAQRKNVVAICLVVWSLLTLFIGIAPNFTTIFVLFLLLGISEAGFFPAAQALLSDYFERARRSRIMSWWSIAQLLGILGGLGVGGALAGLYSGGWRLAFLIVGFPGLLLVFFVWRVKEPRRNQADEEAALVGIPLEKEADTEDTQQVLLTGSVLSQFGGLLRIKTLVVLIAMQVFAFFVLSVSTSFLPTYLQQKDTFGLTSGQAGIYSGGVIVGAGMIGMILGGYISDRLSRRYPGARVLICGIAFLLGAPLYALAVSASSLVLFTSFFVLTAILLAIYTGPCMAATQDVVPPALRASAVALSLLIAHIFGDTFSPSLVGLLATAFDPTHGQHFVQNIAGHEISHAFLLTCTPALVLAGLIGLFGSRWMKEDVARIEREETGKVK